MATKKKAVKKAAAKPKRGSSRRAAKPTKEETVEVTAPGDGVASLLGGNMPPIRDLAYHLKQIKGYQDAAKTASGRVTAAKKAAKEAGVDLQAIALAQGFLRADALDIATTLRQLQALMKEEGLPVQLGLYEPKFGSIEEQAKAEGWRDGLAARNPETTRWPEGAPGHIDYMRRWNDAQKENAMKLSGADQEGSDEE